MKVLPVSGSSWSRLKLVTFFISTVIWVEGKSEWNSLVTFEARDLLPRSQQNQESHGL